MDKLKFYRLTTLGLLLLNIGLVAFFLIIGPTHPKGERGLGRGGTDVLALDEDQHEAFLVLANEHQLLMQAVREEQRELLEVYFIQLSDVDAPHYPNPPERAFELADRKVTSTYQHLYEVKGLLRPDQLDNYSEFVQDVIWRILGRIREDGPPK